VKYNQLEKEKNILNQELNQLNESLRQTEKILEKERDLRRQGEKNLELREEASVLEKKKKETE